MVQLRNRDTTEPAATAAPAAAAKPTNSGIRKKKKPAAPTKKAAAAAAAGKKAPAKKAPKAAAGQKGKKNPAKPAAAAAAAKKNKTPEADVPDPKALQAAAEAALEGLAGPSSAATGAADQIPGPKRPKAGNKAPKKVPAKPKAGNKGKGKEKEKKAAAGAGSRSGSRPLIAAPPGLNNMAIQMQIKRHSALGPRPAGVKKWGRYLLPPFGEPLWKLISNIPTLIIPVLVDPADKDKDHPDVSDGEIDDQELDDEEREARDQAVLAEVERLRNESTQDPGNDEKRKAYRSYTAKLTYAQFRSLGDGFMGEIDDFWNRQDEEERQRKEDEANERAQQEATAQNGDSDDDPDTTGEQVRSPVKQRENPTSKPATPPPRQSPSPTPPRFSLEPGIHDSDGSEFDKQPYDVPKGTKTEGTPQPGDVELVGEDFAKFLRSAHGYEEGWVGRKPLGAGTEAIAGLWEKRDETGRVVDQVAIKQRGTNEFKPLWSSYEPTEVEVMKDLCARPKNGIVKMRGYRRYPKAERHRIYMDYCEHGNLQRLISAYRAKSRHIPEEFIWDVFYHLTNACRVMAQGPSEPALPYLDTYIHCDIKPENIFLAAERPYHEDGTPIYPTAKLGDFGLTIITGDNDPRNPAQLKGHGTPGYKAPEQKLSARRQQDLALDSPFRDTFVEDEVTDDSPKIGSKTNIWEVAACIFKLMELTDAYYSFYGRISKKTGEVMDKIENTWEPGYSQELIDLVHQCLKFYPQDRPDVDQLLSTIVRNRNRFRNLWQIDASIPPEAILAYTREAWNEMEPGSWVRPNNAPSESPPESYTSLDISDSDSPSGEMRR